MSMPLPQPIRRTAEEKGNNNTKLIMANYSKKKTSYCLYANVGSKEAPIQHHDNMLQIML